MAEVGGRVSIASCKSFIILLNVLNVDASICYLPSNLDLDRPSITIAQFGNGLYRNNELHAQRRTGKKEETPSIGLCS